MLYTPAPVEGAVVIRPELAADERGFFARTWCAAEFARNGLNPALVQCGIAWNERRGTLRGMHYQLAPAAEAKLVRCTRGRIFDVAVDLRPASATFLRHAAVELSADERNMLYIPEGCAHGYITLEDGCEVLYHMSAPYRPELARGVRWNDPAFGIEWPIDVEVISERDRTYADYEICTLKS
jgi:dTDP-4-dehydrorhamnose 3,5-epimerase